MRRASDSQVFLFHPASRHWSRLMCDVLQMGQRDTNPQSCRRAQVGSNQNTGEGSAQRHS